MSSMNSLILSMKVFLISAGILSLAVGVKFSAPVAVNGIPAIWSVVMAWLKPPYLYLIINAIIITIAATSRFHQTQSKPPPVQSEHLISVRATPLPEFASFSAHPVINTVMEEQIPAISTVMEVPGSAVVVYGSEDLDRVVDVKPVMVNGSEADLVTEEEMVAETEAGDVLVESPVTYNTPGQEIISPQLESLFPVREKPLVTSRFGHRKPIRTNPEVPGGKALRVTRPKRQDTLESTWKMITEGRHVPLTRHFKKSETFEQRGSHVTPVIDHVPKSEAFNDRAGMESGLRVRKEPSLGQDELNRRVEAFIKKFNEDMRMQRQESLNQYMEMINRGV